MAEKRFSKDSSCRLSESDAEFYMYVPGDETQSVIQLEEKLEKLECQRADIQQMTDKLQMVADKVDELKGDLENLCRKGISQPAEGSNEQAGMRKVKSEAELKTEKYRDACFATTAAATGDLETLERMKREGKDLSHGDYDQRTPLHLAVVEGKSACVDFLLNKCNVDCTVKDRWRTTAHQEARNSRADNKADILRLLEEHIQRQHVDQIVAASTGNVKNLKKLKDEGMPMDCKNDDSRTLLHFACVEGHSGVVEFLLTECGARWDVKDRRGNTPYDHAHEYRHGKVLEVFRNFFRENNIHPPVAPLRLR